MGRYFACCPLSKVPIWLLKPLYSALVKTNMKSSGKRSLFLRTCRFSCFVSTPYNWARSRSSMTFAPWTEYILPVIASIGMRSLAVSPSSRCLVWQVRIWKDLPEENGGFPVSDLVQPKGAFLAGHGRQDATVSPATDPDSTDSSPAGGFHSLAPTFLTRQTLPVNANH